MSRNIARSLHPSFLIGCAFILMLVLSACTTTAQSQSNATASTLPTATPTPEFVQYQGNGYTLSYPKGWKAQEESVPQGDASPTAIATVTIYDQSNINTFRIEEFDNPNGVITPDKLINLNVQGFSANAKNVRDASVPVTTTVSGQTWQQKAVTGDVSQDGLTANAKLVTIACSYSTDPAKSKVYAISYGTATSNFENSDKTYFQSMLQSFHFA